MSRGSRSNKAQIAARLAAAATSAPKSSDAQREPISAAKSSTSLPSSIDELSWAEASWQDISSMSSAAAAASKEQQPSSSKATEFYRKTYANLKVELKNGPDAAAQNTKRIVQPALSSSTPATFSTQKPDTKRSRDHPRNIQRIHQSAAAVEHNAPMTASSGAGAGAGSGNTQTITLPRITCTIPRGAVIGYYAAGRFFPLAGIGYEAEVR